MKLLVDIGNSRLKWTTYQHSALAEFKSVDHRQNDLLGQLSRLWSDIGIPEQVAVASVASPGLRDQVVALARRLWPDIRVIAPQSEASAFGITSAYLRPEQLGVDRWLALIGAHQSYAVSACIVDCGTALTVDFVEADGQHVGGVIAPGLAMMKKALATNTAALPLGQSPNVISLARETDGAIASGSVLAAVGLIELLLARQSKSYGLILTGGDAATIAEHLALPCIVDSELVFKGLLCYCQTEGDR